MQTAYTTVRLPELGEIQLFARGDALVRVQFAGQRHAALPDADARDGAAHPVLRDAAEQIEAYLAGELQRFDLPLAPEGTPFQQQVWERLLAVPFGATTTYGELATGLDVPSSARAVGGAVGRNPISIVVPCHRVVGRDGSLTGFAGGTDRKRHLLALEATGASGHPAHGRSAQPALAI